MDILQKDDELLSEDYQVLLTADRHGIDDSRVFCRFVVGAEQPVLAAKGNGTEGIFYRIVVHFKPAVRMLTCMFVVNVIEIGIAFKDKGIPARSLKESFSNPVVCPHHITGYSYVIPDYPLFSHLTIRLPFKSFRHSNPAGSYNFQQIIVKGWTTPLILKVLWY